jgi:hypothetical protein
VEVSRQAKKIDVVVKCEEGYFLRLKDTAFWFFRRVNSLELKSPEDPLNVADYMLIVSRAYGLLAKQKGEEDRLPENATITILCSVRPDKILDNLQSTFHFSPTSEPGVYLSEEEIVRRIIVATELDVIEKNYPLLILSKGEKLLEFFEEIVRKGLTEYIEIIFQVAVSIDPETLIEGVRRMRERSPEYQASLERAFTNLFTFSPESMERISPFREILEEQRQALEEQRQAQRQALEEQRREFEERERNVAIQAKREALSLLLESKFGVLSETLISQLEAVRDVDKLNWLYRQALQARTLDEAGIPESTNA